MTCLSETQLLAYCGDPPGPAPGVAVHLRVCASCRDVAARLMHADRTHAAVVSRPLLTGMFGAPAVLTDVVLEGKYRIGAALAQGGMGVVYQGVHLALEVPVAIKRLHPHDAAAQPVRLRREAKLLAKLNHPNIVRIFDLVEDPRHGTFVIMELLAGHDLARYVTLAARPSAATLLEWARQLAAGLAASHAQGVVHRDVKPSNVYLVETGEGPRLKLVDFGLGKAQDTDDNALTSSRQLLGSPLYAAPEQLRAPNQVDGRADLWSLGATLFHLATSQAPFAGAHLLEVVSNIATQAPPPVASLRPDLSRALARIIDQCLCRAPDGRPRSAQAISDALAVMAPHPPRARRGWSVFVGAVAVSTALGLGLGALRRERSSTASAPLATMPRPSAGLASPPPPADAPVPSASDHPATSTIGAPRTADVAAAAHGKGPRRSGHPRQGRSLVSSRPAPPPRAAPHVTSPSVAASASVSAAPVAAPVIDPLRDRK